MPSTNIARDRGRLGLRGSAFIALDDCARAEFLDVLDRLATHKSLFKATRLADVRWCLPKVPVRVKHPPGSETLRHAAVKRLSQ